MNKYVILVTGKELETVYETIKSIVNGGGKHMPSSMIVTYEGTAVQLRDEITSKQGDKIDKVVVLKLTGDAAGRGINESGSSGIKNNL